MTVRNQEKPEISQSKIDLSIISMVVSGLGLILTAIALIYAVRGTALVQKTNKSITIQLNDIQKNTESVTIRLEKLDIVSRLVGPFPEPSIVSFNQAGLQDGYIEVKPGSKLRYMITSKGKELLNQLYPKNQLNSGLQDKITDILSKDPEISNANLLLTLDIGTLQDLTKKFNKEMGKNIKLDAVLGTIIGFANEFRKEYQKK